ncbi:hypothetical protein Theos_1301 [Thermus oshimai JL-2]|uniref:Uncharacterized protein n=1 Tax=Thermus oshimai JL-2 TaxID=751945 RepID=K7R5Z5_THEOS|nr:hypothetical protein [Thermus oshimai]AFV76339.1 hypothetical protein Theos_1301 [Thermus oshimai JL-2]
MYKFRGAAHKALPAKERGRVVVAGLKALGLWEEGDGEEAGQR